MFSTFLYDAIYDICVSFHSLDEEIGGRQGMKKFVQHKEFTKLNVGFALDEGKLLCLYLSDYERLHLELE